MHCTKILPEFEFGGHRPQVHTPKNVALGYDVGKISDTRDSVNYIKYCTVDL